MKQNYTGAKAHTKKTFKTILFSLAVIATVLCSLLQFTSCKKNKAPKVTSKVEFQALKDFYKATGGENWTKKWDTTNTDITTWYGVTMTGGDAFSQDKDGTLIRNIEAISLPNNNLTGNLPVSLGNLGNLKELNLSNNSIEGAIPASLGNNIKNIDLRNNLFDGFFPVALMEAIGKHNGLSSEGDITPFIKICPQKGNQNLTGFDCIELL